jgi:hypothetical protein
MNTVKTTNTQEKGNVLFLILIAVALFAALSYAVTQSSRSGGDASRETNLLNSAQITQYPTSLQTAALRMIIDGNSASSIWYTPPALFGTTSTQYLFHPTGGGAVYSTVPANLMAGSSDGYWFVNGDFAIGNIGTTSADIIAFLPGISLDLCKKINSELGVGAADGTPTAFASDVDATYTRLSADYTFTGSTSPLLATATAATTSATAVLTQAINVSPTAFHADYDSQPFGCFQNGGGSGEYVYYHAIIER